MKHNWEYKELKNIGEILTGSTPSTSVPEFYDQSDYMFVKPGDIDESRITYLSTSATYISELAFNTASRKLPKQSVLVTCIGTIGKVGILLKEATCNQQINAIIPSNNIDYKYLAYAISSIKFVLISKKNGPVVPIINKSQFSKFKIPVPPLLVQEQIVSELDKINEVIDDCKKLLSSLDSLAQSLFYDTFGDPVTNPKGWEVVPFEDLCQLSAGGDKPKDTVTECSPEKNVPIYSNGIDNEGLYGYTSTPRITEPSLTISGRGTLGIPFIRKTPFVPIIRLIVATPKSNINLVFLFFLIKLLKLGGKGAAIPQLTVPMVKKLMLPTPPIELQNQFAERIEAIEEQKKAVENTIATLKTLLDSRMDYWFN